MKRFMGGELQDLSVRTREFDRGLTGVPGAKTGGLLQALALAFLALAARVTSGSTGSVITRPWTYAMT